MSDGSNGTLVSVEGEGKGRVQYTGKSLNRRNEKMENLGVYEQEPIHNCTFIKPIFFSTTIVW